MNKTFHILIFTLLCSANAINCYAQGADKKAEHGRAYISFSGIFAETVGKGSTKEEAEQAAYTYATLQILKQINELSPEKSKILWKGYNLPIKKIHSWGLVNDSIFDEGADQIAIDKSNIQGYWEYAGGIYTYNLSIFINFQLIEAKESSDNANTEKAETPLE